MSKKSKKQKNRISMYRGWLFPELKHHIDSKVGVDIECLKTSLCLTVGSVTIYRMMGMAQKADVIQLATASYSLICELDSEFDALEVNSPEFKTFITKLAKNDAFYREYIEKLYAIIRSKVLSGHHEDVNGLFRQSNDFKQWLTETGVMLVQIELIDGWMHPLSEFELEGDRELMDLWAAASLMCGVATGRYQAQEGFEDPRPALSNLENLGVIDKSDRSFVRIEAAKCVDNVYIELIQETKDKLEQKCEEAFSAAQ